MDRAQLTNEIRDSVGENENVIIHCRFESGLFFINTIDIVATDRHVLFIKNNKNTKSTHAHLYSEISEVYAKKEKWTKYAFGFFMSTVFIVFGILLIDIKTIGIGFVLLGALIGTASYYEINESIYFKISGRWIIVSGNKSNNIESLQQLLRNRGIPESHNN